MYHTRQVFSRPRDKTKKTNDALLVVVLHERRSQTVKRFLNLPSLPFSTPRINSSEGGLCSIAKKTAAQQYAERTRATILR